MDDLKLRHDNEEKFHNRKYSEANTSPLHYKYNPTSVIFDKLKEKIGDIKGLRVLECGCGSGWMTAELLEMGAIVDSFDISIEAVDSTEKLLKKHDLIKNCTLKKMSVENLDYPDNTYDVVIGFAILHHLDMHKSIKEIFRVLKPSGCAYFAEPLSTNPIINIYRKLTPQYRTTDEHPLDLTEITKYIIEFKKFEHEEFFFTALIPFIFIYLPYLNKYFHSALRPFLLFDRIILKYFPYLGKYAWYSILMLEKN